MLSIFRFYILRTLDSCRLLLLQILTPNRLKPLTHWESKIKMNTKIKKRFIAGAICPHCKASDSLMLYMQNNVEKVECVKCGYAKSQVHDEVEQKTRKSENVIGIFKPSN